MPRDVLAHVCQTTGLELVVELREVDRDAVECRAIGALQLDDGDDFERHAEMLGDATRSKDGRAILSQSVRRQEHWPATGGVPMRCGRTGFQLDSRRGRISDWRRH